MCYRQFRWFTCQYLANRHCPLKKTLKMSRLITKFVIGLSKMISTNRITVCTVSMGVSFTMNIQPNSVNMLKALQFSHFLHSFCLLPHSITLSLVWITTCITLVFYYCQSVSYLTKPTELKYNRSKR